MLALSELVSGLLHVGGVNGTYHRNRELTEEGERYSMEKKRRRGKERYSKEKKKMRVWGHANRFLNGWLMISRL